MTAGGSLRRTTSLVAHHRFPRCCDCAQVTRTCPQRCTGRCRRRAADPSRTFFTAICLSTTRDKRRACQPGCETRLSGQRITDGRARRVRKPRTHTIREPAIMRPWPRSTTCRRSRQRRQPIVADDSSASLWRPWCSPWCCSSSTCWFTPTGCGSARWACGSSSGARSGRGWSSAWPPARSSSPSSTPTSRSPGVCRRATTPSRASTSSSTSTSAPCRVCAVAVSSSRH